MSFRKHLLVTYMKQSLSASAVTFRVVLGPLSPAENRASLHKLLWYYLITAGTERQSRRFWLWSQLLINQTSEGDNSCFLRNARERSVDEDLLNKRTVS